jgi:hypothetical protein
MRSAIATAWPHIRAALVAFHCVAVALVAAPAPSESASVLAPDDPRFASELHPWAKLLDLSDEAFATRLEHVRARWVEGRRDLLAPFTAYLELVGARQPWNMFAAPNRTPSRFTFEVRDVRRADPEAGWIFLAGLPSGSWRRSFFESERSRSFLNNVARSGAWSLADDLCAWLAGRAFDEGPWREARCSFVSAEAPSWRVGAPPSARSTMDHSLVVDR